MNKTWLDDAFFESETLIKAVMVLEDEETATESKQVVTINKFNDEKEINPDWEDILNSLTAEKIYDNTTAREKRKAEEAKQDAMRRAEIEKSKALEALFEAKIKAFEVEEIKNSNNRQLKTKLRRAKNTVEVNIYAMMIVMEEINKGEENNDKESTD